MTYLKYVLIGVLTVFIAYLTLCLFTPSHVAISQTTVINAPIDTVFKHVNNVQQWPQWHPWFRKNNAKNVESLNITKDSIVWESAQEKGGRIVLTSFTPNQSIQTQLTYQKDGHSKINKGEFLFEETNGRTKVSWILVGTEYPFLLKPATIVIKSIFTKNFEMGLKNLKALSEGRPLPEVSRVDSM